MNFLTIESPHTGVNMSILVITNLFIQYVKPVITSTQTAKATATAFWNEFITNYGFPEILLTDQDQNFECQLIKEF